MLPGAEGDAMASDPNQNTDEGDDEDLGTAGLTQRILIGMGLGLLLGLGINLAGATGMVGDLLVGGLLHVGGAVFLASLKLLVVPLVFVSLVCGTAALDDLAKLGRLGGRTLLLYLVTTAIAITLAIGAASLIQPGAGFDLPTDLAFEGREAPPLSDTFIQIFPTNPIKAMAEGNMLQIIVFADPVRPRRSRSRGRPASGCSPSSNDINGVILRLGHALLMTDRPLRRLLPDRQGVRPQQGFGAILPLARSTSSSSSASC